VVIYKLDGSKKMEMSEEEATAVQALWVMYGNSFAEIPPKYSIRIQGKKVYLCQTTLVKPEPPKSYELNLDF
jgi:hypothetical protein